MAQSRPQPASDTGLSKVAKNIGSTAKILVELNKNLLLKAEENLPDNHPIIMAIKQFTVINCRTAQLSDDFHTLPDARTKRDLVESSLGKLKTIPTPAAKTSSELFTSQFSGPSESVKQALTSMDTIRNEYKALISDQHVRIENVIDRLRNAKDPESMLRSQDIRQEFISQDTRRVKVSHDLTVLDKNLRSTLFQLDNLFTQIYNSIPLTERKGIATAVATTTSKPEDKIRPGE